MSDHLFLDPEQALDATARLTDAGSSYFDLRYSAGAEICHASEARPWGRDDIGATFDQNYRPIEQQVMAAWLQLSAFLENIAAAAEHTVRQNIAADEQARAEVQRAYRQP